MRDLNQLTLPELYEELSGTGLVRRLVELAHDEDLGEVGDVTSRLCVPASARCEAALLTREPCVVAGLAVVEEVLDVFAPTAVFRASVADGSTVAGGAVLGRLMGPRREVLAVERTLLNIVSRLCGIATLTRRFVEAVSGTGAAVFDTRKTTPGLRVLEKYAVRCGGGMCHRMGLYDAVLIKDNHIAGLSAGEVREAVAEAAREAWKMRARPGLRFVEVEVDSIDQLKQVLTIEQGAIDAVLLDNMTPGQLAEAVATKREFQSDIILEASGGVTLENVAEIARAGVDRISVGALTHHASSIDLTLELSGTIR